MASEFISWRAPASIIVHILVRRLSVEMASDIWMHLSAFYGFAAATSQGEKVVVAYLLRHAPALSSCSLHSSVLNSVLLDFDTMLGIRSK
ncbi:hypothetical protein Peur_059971 [Populus x canadensis]